MWNRRGFRKPHTIFWYIGATSKRNRRDLVECFSQEAMRSGSVHSWCVGLPVCPISHASGAPEGLHKFGWSGPLVFRVCLSTSSRPFFPRFARRGVQAECKVSRGETQFLHKFGARGPLVFRVCLSQPLPVLFLLHSASSCCCLFCTLPVLGFDSRHPRVKMLNQNGALKEQKKQKNIEVKRM